MAFIPVADTLMLELRQSLFGQRIENTFGFRLTGGWSPAQLTALMNGMLLWWTNELAPHLSADISLRELVATDLSSSTGPVVTQAAPIPNPDGGVGFGSLPGNCGLCVSFRTNARGRSFRGRNFVAGLPETEVTGNTVSPTLVNNIQTAYNEIIIGGAQGAFEWVVISRFSNNAPRVAGVATQITTAVIVDPFIDSQRRRLTARGL